jgi:hypothetical protein
VKQSTRRSEVDFGRHFGNPRNSRIVNSPFGTIRENENRAISPGYSVGACTPAAGFAQHLADPAQE